MPHKTIGFIGLGTMGLPMAKNLLDAGYEVVGYNRSAEPMDDLVAAGGMSGESPADVANRTDVVLLCLPDSPDVEKVVFGTNGESDPVIDGLSEEMTVIDHSTISPMIAETIAEDLAAEGVDMLDAPISGGEEGAIDGSLSIMVGGDNETLTEQRDVLEAVGETITHCGPAGAGQTTKACNQIVVAAQLVGVSEALLFAEKAEAELESVVDAISSGAAGCWVLDNRATTMIEGEFDAGFLAEYQYKDLRIAVGAGEDFGAPLPLTSIAHELFKSMVATGKGRDDNSGVLQVLETLAGTEARVDGE